MPKKDFRQMPQRVAYSSGREPATAAMLSVIPGLGQFYNGQSVKGFLFMDVAAVNALLLLIVLFAEPLATGLRNLLTGNHMRPNDGILQALASAHLGTPFSMVLVSMILLFVGFAVRDAYDYARAEKLKPIYADSALHLSEAASGSYLFHFAAMISCAVFALFFLIPKPEVQQVTEIEFTDPLPKDVEPVHAKKFSSESSSARHRDTKAEKPTPPNSTASSAHSQAAQRQVQNAAKEIRPAKPELKESPVKQPPKEAPPKQIVKEAPRQIVKEAPAKGEPAPVVKPIPIVKPVVAPPKVNPVPVPLPQSVAPKAVTPTSAVAPAPIHTKAPATASAPPLPFLAMAPQSLATIGPAPMALNRPQTSTAVGSPMPAEAKRRSSSSAAGNGPPAPVNSISSSTDSGTPTPVPGAHTSTPGHSTNADSGARPTKIAAVAPIGGGSVVPAVGPAKTGPVGPGPAGPSSQPRIDSQGLNPPAGHGKSLDNVDINPDFGPYMAELQRRIKRNWQPPKDRDSRQVVVEFKIFKSGELGSVRLARSSGLSTNDQAAISAIRAAAPFMPLPKYSEDSVDIQFTFDYRVFAGHASY